MIYNRGVPEDGSRFPTTSLSLVLDAREGREDRLRHHVERLCQRYWRPVYRFVRRSRDASESEDLTQAFFVHVMEHEVLRRFDPERGNLRAFLKTCLQNFLALGARADQRLKRGGGRKTVSFEAATAGDAPADPGPPEEAFDRDWLREVLDQAVAALELELKRRDREIVFQVFRLHDLHDGPDERPGYDALAERLGISRADVGNHLRAARRDLRRIVLKGISEYVVDGTQVLGEEELVRKVFEW
jgi:RNA polymerase sigma-70 factor (ECF subfamily)